MTQRELKLHEVLDTIAQSTFARGLAGLIGDLETARRRYFKEVTPKTKVLVGGDLGHYTVASSSDFETNRLQRLMEPFPELSFELGLQSWKDVNPDFSVLPNMSMDVLKKPPEGKVKYRSVYGDKEEYKMVPFSAIRDLIINQLSLVDPADIVQTPVAIFSILMAIPHDFLKACPSWRMLRWYVFRSSEQMGRVSKRGPEPVFSTIETKVILTLMQGTVHTYMMRDCVARSELFTLNEEMSRFLVTNPLARTQDLKGLISQLKSAAFAASTTGDRFIYPGSDLLAVKPVILTWRRVDITHNDYKYYQWKKTVIKEAIADLQKLGVPRFARAWTHLLSARHDSCNRRLWVYLHGMLGWCGFSRTEKVKSFHKQDTTEFPKHTGEFDPFLKEEMEHVMGELRSGGFDGTGGPDMLTEEEYLAGVSSVLTSKGAGTGTRKVTLNLESSGRPVRLRFSDKRMIFISAPELATVAEAYSYDEERGYVGPVIGTSAFPASNGHRDVVGGKARRKITVTPLVDYLHGIPVDSMILRNQSQKSDVLMRYGTNADYKVMRGNDTGVSLQDSASSLIASSTPGVITSDKDFSSFDSSQGLENVRKPLWTPFYEGMKPFDKKMKLYDAKGGVVETTMLEMHKRVVFKTHGMVFESFTGKGKDYERHYRFTANALLSGEYRTLWQNNTVNRAFSRFVVPQLQKSGKFTLMRSSFQGDDSEEYWLVNSSYESDDLKKWGEIYEEYAAKAGMGLNALKGTLREYGGEYLKVFTTYGAWYRLMYTPIFSAENRTNDVDVVSILQGKKSVFNGLLERGAEHDVLMKILYGMALMRTGFRILQRRRGKVEPSTVYIHAMWLFIPKALGGAGLTTTLLGANQELLCWKNSLDFDPELRRLVSGHQLKPSDLDKKVATSLINGEGTIDKAHSFVKGVEYLRSHLIKDRVDNAYAAEKRLKAVGYKIPKGLFYPDQPETAIVEAIRGNGRVRELRQIRRNGYIPVLRRLQRGHGTYFLPPKFNFLRALEFKFTEAFAPTPHPFDVQHHKLHALGALGPGSSFQSLRAEEELLRVIRDRNQLANFSLSQIFSELTGGKLPTDELKVNFLVSIGVLPNRARKAVVRLKNLLSGFTSRDVIAFSLRDFILPNFDVNKVSEVVAVRVSRQARMYCEQFGILVAMNAFTDTGVLRKVRITVKDDMRMI